MKQLISLFHFKPIQRIGILVLLTISITIQWITTHLIPTQNPTLPSTAQQWLAQQTKIDSLKQTKFNQKPILKPFNPNFISDYKASLLGLNILQINRLQKFRKQDQWINSALQFKQVTQIPDSLYQKLLPYITFPDWVTHPKKYNPKANVQTKISQTDFNQATPQQLINVPGIAQKRADQILQLKQKFGNFASFDQLQLIYNFPQEVIETLKENFFINNPILKKININNASQTELAQFPYFNYTIAKQIVLYRSMNGLYNSKTDWTKIPAFPAEKIDIILLYLDF